MIHPLIQETVREKEDDKSSRHPSAYMHCILSAGGIE